jgi:hypothetical protein
MFSVPSNVGVFFGKADKGSQGWYWTDSFTSQNRKGSMRGPFETKQKAVENAVESLAAQASSKTMRQEKGALREHLG